LLSNINPSSVATFDELYFYFFVDANKHIHHVLFENRKPRTGGDHKLTYPFPN